MDALHRHSTDSCETVRGLSLNVEHADAEHELRATGTVRCFPWLDPRRTCTMEPRSVPEIRTMMATRTSTNKTDSLVWLGVSTSSSTFSVMEIRRSQYTCGNQLASIGSTKNSYRSIGFNKKHDKILLQPLIQLGARNNRTNRKTKHFKTSNTQLTGTQLTDTQLTCTQLTDWQLTHN